MVDLFLCNMLCHLARPDEINRHDVGRGEEIVQRDGCNRTSDIRRKAVNPMRSNPEPMKEKHSVAFATSDIEN
jgi:hypothetical protein